MAAHHPIAVCPIHGLFPATSILISGGSTASFVNSGTTCPHCGATSEIIPGTYTAGIDRLNVLIDPSISLPALGALRKLAERARDGELSLQEAKREAEKIHPKAGKLFDISNWSDQAKATLYGAIIGAAAVIAAARIASSPSQTTIINPTVVERVVEELPKSLLPKTPLPKARPRKLP